MTACFVCRRQLHTTSRQLANHYQTLGITADASRSQIKQAFHKLSKTYHPDLGTARASERKFAEISEAYNTLSHERSRKDYDRSISFSQSPFTTNAARQSTANYAWAQTRKQHPSTYHHPFRRTWAQQSTHKYDYTSELFERMQARADRTANLWGTQANKQRMQQEKHAWDNAAGTSIARRFQHILIALGVVYCIAHLTTVSAETMSEKVAHVRRDVQKGSNVQHMHGSIDSYVQKMFAKESRTPSPPDDQLSAKHSTQR